PYSVMNTARDNWFLAFFTFGEGYHNFHHAFPSDYRNGIRWYHWDPTKWVIGSLSLTGMSWGLKRTSHRLIERAKGEAVKQADRLRAQGEAAVQQGREALQQGKDAF